MQSSCVLVTDIHAINCRYTFMKKCWKSNAEKRPTFSELVNYLSAYLESFVDYVKLIDQDTEVQSVNLEEQNNPLAVLGTSAVNETVM